jgi:hypothetical protein
MTRAQVQADLEAAAHEEMERACDLGWERIAQVTPWGDTFEGYTPEGREVCFERNYLWAGDPGFDIRVEVVVYEPRDYEHGARLVRDLSRSVH